MTRVSPIKPEVAERYLSLYLGEPSLNSWEVHLRNLYNQKKRYLGEDQAKLVVRKNIAFALMLRYKEKTKIPDPVQNVLFGAEKWSQYDNADWSMLFQEVLDEDEQIKDWRNQALSLGVIHPIEYCPVTRQAFNWLYDKAQETGAVTDTTRVDLIEKFKKLVLAYGGNVICNIFTKNATAMKREVISWKTNYFFERVIFQVYDIDQILKIKRQELAKANPKLVKQIRKD